MKAILHVDVLATMANRRDFGPDRGQGLELEDDIDFVPPDGFVFRFSLEREVVCLKVRETFYHINLKTLFVFFEDSETLPFDQMLECGWKKARMCD